VHLLVCDDRWITVLYKIISRSVLLEMGNVSNKSCKENRNMRFTFKNFFFRKSCLLCDNVEKYCGVGQGTDYNMAHARCMLDDKDYKHTLRMRNTYCLSTATMAEWTRLSVTLYVHCMCCFTFYVKSGLSRTDGHSFPIQIHNTDERPRCWFLTFSFFCGIYFTDVATHAI
jgi:hypothetical protein